MSKLDDMTIGGVLELARMFGGCASPSDAGSEFKTGQRYLVRTVTHTTIGQLVRRTATGLVFDTASWVADTGRFGAALAHGPARLSEVEYRGDGVIVAIGAIVDADVWRHELPTETK